MKTQNTFTTFYIIRHAEAENNVKEIIGADSDLTKQGKKQAKLLAKKLAHIQFDAIFSSHSLRTRHTAKMVVRSRKHQIIVDKNLRERDYGKYEGVSIKKYREQMIDVLKKTENMLDDELKIFRRYEGFETDQELMNRFMTSLKRFAILYKGEKLLVVTHGLIMRVFLIYLGFATYKTLPTFSVENTGYIKVAYDGSNFIVEETQGINKLT